MKKELFEKIMLSILTFILIVYISLSLIILSSFNISKKILNKNNVSEFINNIDVVSIIKNELGTELKQFNIIQDGLNDIGITTDGMKNFVNSEDVKELSSDIITNMFNKLSNNNIDYKITNEQINELVEKNIDKIETKSNITEEKLLNKIESKIPDFVLNINQILDMLYKKLSNLEVIKKYQSYAYKTLGILDIIYSNFIAGLIVFIISSFIILLMYIRRSFYKSLKWLSISFIIPTMFFGIISTVIYSYIKIENVLINNMLTTINKNLISHSVIYFTISIIFVIINILVYMVKKCRSKEKVNYGKKKYE